MLAGKFIWVYCTLLLVLMASFQDAFNRKELYGALAGESVEAIDQLVVQLKKDNDNQLYKAYIGALSMKRAGLMKVAPGVKLKTFKEGAVMLESIIEENPDNAEYRLLRLIIQENAPRILKYHKNIEEDKNLIVDQFNELDKSLKSEIRNYGKTSEALKDNEILTPGSR